MINVNCNIFEKLNEGLSWVKLDFRNLSENRHCKILSNHFWKGLCKDARYRVEIIEKIEGTDRVYRSTMDPK